MYTYCIKYVFYFWGYTDSLINQIDYSFGVKSTKLVPNTHWILDFKLIRLLLFINLYIFITCVTAKINYFFGRLADKRRDRETTINFAFSKRRKTTN